MNSFHWYIYTMCFLEWTAIGYWMQRRFDKIHFKRLKGKIWRIAILPMAVAFGPFILIPAMIYDFTLNNYED